MEDDNEINSPTGIAGSDNSSYENDPSVTDSDSQLDETKRPDIVMEDKDVDSTRYPRLATKQRARGKISIGVANSI